MQKGAEWAVPQTNMNATQRNPAIAGYQDTIAVVWEESGFGDNAVDLLIALSTNGSQSLYSNFTNITQAPGYQLRPSLAYASGVFHLTYANSGGTLLYQQGQLSSLTSITNINRNTLPFQLVTQAISNQTIELIYNKTPSTTISFDAILNDTAGKPVQSWKNVSTHSNETIKLEFPKIPSGVYFLSLLAEKGAWSNRVLIVD